MSVTLRLPFVHSLFAHRFFNAALQELCNLFLKEITKQVLDCVYCVHL